MRYRVAADTPQIYEIIKEILTRTSTVRAVSDRRRLLSVDDIPEEVQAKIVKYGASVRPERFFEPGSIPEGRVA